MRSRIYSTCIDLSVHSRRGTRAWGARRQSRHPPLFCLERTYGSVCALCDVITGTRTPENFDSVGRCFVRHFDHKVGLVRVLKRAIGAQY
jgi:hypothetical protein